MGSQSSLDAWLSKSATAVKDTPPMQELIDLTSSHSSPSPRRHEEDGSPSPRKRRKLDDTEMHTGSAEEGEIVSESGSVTNGPTGLVNLERDVEPSPKHQPGWNSGIASSGLRTSFGQNVASTSRPVPPPKQTARLVTTTEPQDSGDDMMNGAEQSKPPRDQAKAAHDMKSLTFSKDGLDFTLPDIRQTDQKNHENWQVKFEHWCKDFCVSNQNHAAFINPSLLVDAFLGYIYKAGPRGKNSKMSAKRAAQNTSPDKLEQLIAQDQTKDLSGQAGDGVQGPQDEPEPSASEWASLLGNPEARVDEQGSDTKVAAPVPLQKKNTIFQLSRQQELDELRKYFPGVPEDRAFCVLCASRAHLAKDCPETSCNFCVGIDHISSNCPTRHRCTKCRQIGHAKPQCREKLALAPGEGVRCAFCASSHHLETSCTDNWRSYRREPEDTRKVKSIPAYCYYCGSDAHFGGVCPLNNGVHISGRPFNRFDGIWSNEVRDMYVDSESNILPIGWVPPLPPDHPTDDRPNIPGRSLAPQRHVYFSDSENDDDGFIREPVQRPQANSQIRFADQLGQNSRFQEPAPNGYRGGRNQIRDAPQNGRGNTRANRQPPPPLPPGPPPSRHAPNGRSGEHPPPEQPRRSFPPRPQAQQNNNRPNQGAGHRGGGVLGRRGRPRRVRVGARPETAGQ